MAGFAWANVESRRNAGAPVHGEGAERLPFPRRSTTLASLAFLYSLSLCCAVALPAGWQKEQRLELTAPGLVKLALPPATLDSARPALEDLRLYDDAGNEVPFFIERPVPAGKATQAAKSFQVSLNPSTTVITLETGLAQPLDGVTLETPAQNFIKAVRVEGSADGQSWQPLAQGQPVFRQAYSAGQLRVAFPAGAWRKLRLTVDDQRSPAIPVTGARIHAAAAEPTPGEIQFVTITERNENPGETRLTLNLGAANLDVASVKIATGEPLFTRSISLLVPRLTELGLFEQVIGQGVIYRIAVEGQSASAQLSVPLEQPIRSRELVLTINNGDSPPLPISAVSVERRPVYLVFLARSAGTFHLLTGNSFCNAPRYDLSALRGDLKSAAITAAPLSTLADNSDYRPPEALAGIEPTGAALDVSDWKYRKPIDVSRSGAQQVELDLDVLAHAAGSLADLRVMQGSNQVPAITQRTSISRSLIPTVTAATDAKNPKLSRWLIKLPQSHLPIMRLTCTSPSPLFQRTLTLIEERTDERGNTSWLRLANPTWIQTPEQRTPEFSLSWNILLQGDSLILETDNGDNPHITLENFTAFYSATRLLFKARTGEDLYLYYGNHRAAAPSYDLDLVAAELLAADKTPAKLGPAEQLKKSSWAESHAPGSGGFVFWGILAVVVVGLLAIITRLLPKAPAA